MNLAAHLPALQVVVPLIAAPLCVLARDRRAAFGIALSAAWCALAIAVALWWQVPAGGAISYAIGSWPPPWGIEYRVDALSAFVLVLVSGIAALVLPYCRATLDAEVAPAQQYLFYTMLTLCLAGLLGIAITGDAFNVFVFLEISSLSTYVLIALGRDRRALLAAYQYLVMGTIGATFIVIGIGLLYLMTGTLNLVDMANRLAAVRGSRPVLAALAFLTVGLSLKIALFPLHQWLPGAYGYAPSAVSAFLAGTATKVAMVVLLRMCFAVFGESQVFGALPMQQMFLLLALAGMFVASGIAVFQTDLKRLFAYSSVGQIGYIVLGMSFDSATGLTASIVHMFNHGVAKGAIFMLLGGVAAGVGGVSLARAHGLGRVMPVTSLALVICGFSLVGVPGTVGFITKWHLVLAALEQGRWWLVFAILLSSIITLAYVWRVVEVMYLREPRQDLAHVRESRWPTLAPALLLVAAVIYFGIDTSFSIGSAAAAADLLLRAGR
jgi:multicomponent Na+:H+ antiporter subunit D